MVRALWLGGDIFQVVSDEKKAGRSPPYASNVDVKSTSSAPRG